jgi:hypothetical protein
MRTRFFVYLLTTVPLVIITWAIVHTHPGLQIDWNDPLASVMSIDPITEFEGILQIVILFAAGRAFQLITASDLLQTPIPGFLVVLLLVVATRDSLGKDPTVLVCLALLCATTLYLFGHQQVARWYPQHPALRTQRRVLRYAALFSLFLFPVAMLFAWLAQPVNMEMLALRRTDRATPGSFRLPFSFGGRVGLSYPDSVEIGGSALGQGKQEIMRVTVPSSVPLGLLWRGGSYDYYQDGEWTQSPQIAGSTSRLTPGWSGSDQGNLDETGSPIYHIELDLKGDQIDPGIAQWISESNPEKLVSVEWMKRQEDTKGTIRIQQIFEVTAPLLQGKVALYGAYQSYSADGKASMLKRSAVSDDGAITFINARSQSTMPRYTVYSIVKPPPITLKLKGDPVLPDMVRAHCLQMPLANNPANGEDVASAIHKRALEILQQNALTEQSDKRRIVEQFSLFLGQNYRYTLTPSRPGNRQDPIVDFLTAQKKGYCTYFASSLVLLCRSVGIPARFVTGFAMGDQLPAESREGVSVYQVHASDAHAWTEVFLPNYGWYTVDPTSGAQPVQNTWEVLVETVSRTSQAISQWWATTVEAFNTSRRARLQLIAGALALIIGIAAVLWFFSERPPRLPRRELDATSARQLVLQSYARMHRWLQRWGVYKPDGLTALEFSRRFREVNPALAAPVLVVCDLYVRAMYADAPLSDADARRAITQLRTLWDTARRERKRLYAKTEA